MRTALTRLAALSIALLALGLLVPRGADAENGQGIAWAITVTPIESHVGDLITIQATAFGQGGIPEYTLHVDDPEALGIESPASVHTSGLGIAVSWDVRALQGGIHTFYVTVNYEKQVCAGPDDEPPCPSFFVLAQSESVPLSVELTLGDANCDGTANAVDAAVVLQAVAGYIDEVPCPEQADMNRNDKITALDALLILQQVGATHPIFP